MNKFKQALSVTLYFFAIMTAVEIINMLSGRSLASWGIIPRYLPGLRGILFAPFIHGNFAHYLSNIVPLCLFIFLIAQQQPKRFWVITGLGITFTGLLVWIIGSKGHHIGASGLLYCYFGYLALHGFINRKPLQILLSVFICISYGGMIWGIFPRHSGISWESHLAGLITGLVIAYTYRR